MPELPEVEVVRRGLEQWVAGRTVATVEVHHPRAVRRHLEGAEHFVAALTGRTLAAAHRRGKYLWLPVAEPDGAPSGRALVAHLGMSGQLLVEKRNQPDETHLRARFTFTDGGRELRFVDQRTFGGLAVEESGADGAIPPRLAHIAIDPLDGAFDVDAFSAALRRRRTEVKRALLDQTLIGGVGNIYADEALWRARLHGARPTDKLTRGRSPTCSTVSGTCWGRPSPRAVRRSTRCTSTSTGRAATSPGSSPSTARPTGPAPGAGHPSAGSRS